MNGAERLKKIVRSDSGGGAKAAMAVLRSDLEDMLSQYMDLRSVSVRVDGQEGNYTVTVEARTAGFYSLGKSTAIE